MTRGTSFFHPIGSFLGTWEKYLKDCQSSKEIRDVYKDMLAEYDRLEQRSNHYRFMQEHLANEMLGIFRYLGKEYKHKEKLTETYNQLLNEFLDKEDENIEESNND